MALFRKTTAPALVASLTLHLVAGAAVGLRHLAVPPAAREVSGLEIEIDRTSVPEVQAPEAPPEPSTATAAAVAIARGVAPLHEANAVAPPLPSPPGSREGENAPAPAPAESGGTWSFPRGTPVDLGVGTYWKSVASSSDPVAVAPPAGADAPPSPASSAHKLNQILREGLDAHDRSLGLSASSPLVTAAHEAASPSIAPDVGTATFDVESDANGRVVAAHVVSSSADSSAWNDVAQELVKLMSAKALHVAGDSRGLRTRLRIVAERTMPSGARTALSGALTPGAGPEGGCDGTGWTRRCGEGMPTGATKAFDISDIGARASRIVRVQLLGEVPL